MYHISFKSNEYYYSALEPTERQIYSEILNSCLMGDNLSFSWRKQIFRDNIVNFELLKIIEYVLLDNPYIFHLNLSSIFIESKNNRVNLSIPSFYSQTQILSISEKLKNSIDSCISSIGSDQTETEIITNLVEFFLNNTIYDTSTANVKNKRMAHEAIGAVLNGACTCAGAAKAMTLFCDACNINCIIVRGQKNMGGWASRHMWNIVKINNEWQHIDIASMLCKANGMKEKNEKRLFLCRQSLENIYHWDKIFS